jgi:hypothetical protein
MSVIPALGRLKQENHDYEATLGYIARPCLNNDNKYFFKPEIFPRKEPSHLHGHSFNISF